MNVRYHFHSRFLMADAKRTVLCKQMSEQIFFKNKAMTTRFFCSDKFYLFFKYVLEVFLKKLQIYWCSINIFVIL